MNVKAHLSVFAKHESVQNKPSKLLLKKANDSILNDDSVFEENNAE